MRGEDAAGARHRRDERQQEKHQPPNMRTKPAACPTLNIHASHYLTLTAPLGSHLKYHFMERFVTANRLANDAYETKFSDLSAHEVIICLALVQKERRHLFFF